MRPGDLMLSTTVFLVLLTRRAIPRHLIRRPTDTIRYEEIDQDERWVATARNEVSARCVLWHPLEY